ncbi:MAG: Hpt domain-containing protein [bacterium]|nr:Hpt domain-containing protein [bacterium]
MNSTNSTHDKYGETNATSTAAPIEMASLLHRCMGNIDFAERMLKRFEETFEVQIDELSQQSGEDRDEISRLAHRMKGAAANISAPLLEQSLVELHEITSQENPVSEVAIEGAIVATASAWKTTREYLAIAEFSKGGT